MFDGKRFLPLMGIPIAKMLFSRTLFADCDPEPRSLKKNIGVSSASHGPLLVDPAHCMIVVRQWMRCSSAE